ncbi:ribonuclease P protein component [Candidatus Kaiserbacteria bacterium RIFCSPHIGHO2_01_FULL_56_24]|uniref:Ribonuclease P protein component n=1 Tax=Candidatus Kaiserbacteria bacterium RIFCSPHIGHO2_01_FULL_56_24 TaxID=1798487 RepID=A0A1F6DGK1_9BACT|nr:MAG: ribonuclease P protein component [Candidatus Kaiserbacteria bacterium RIFCSPHIGHO2_01_FULL_56_24]
MPKKYRLSRADFMRLPRAAHRIHGKYFSLTVTHVPSLEGPRAVCVVSKKISARSVDRNRIERLCRESLRPVLAQMKTPAALVFYAKREVLGAALAEIRQDIRKLLERTG